MCVCAPIITFFIFFSASLSIYCGQCSRARSFSVASYPFMSLSLVQAPIRTLHVLRIIRDLRCGGAGQVLSFINKLVRMDREIASVPH